VVRYALVDVNQIRHNVQVSDDMLKQQYQANIQQYQVPNRVHVEHILFMTVGKTTDAEVEEVKKKAEDVLKQSRRAENSKTSRRSTPRIPAPRTRAVT